MTENLVMPKGFWVLAYMLHGRNRALRHLNRLAQLLEVFPSWSREEMEALLSSCGDDVEATIEEIMRLGEKGAGIVPAEVSRLKCVLGVIICRSQCPVSNRKVTNPSLIPILGGRFGIRRWGGRRVDEAPEGGPRQYYVEVSSWLFLTVTD